MTVLEMKPKNPEGITIDHYYQLIETGMVLPPAVRDSVLRLREVPDLSVLEPQERNAVLEFLQQKSLHVGNGFRSVKKSKKEMTRGEVRTETKDPEPVRTSERKQANGDRKHVVNNGRCGLALLM